MSKAKHTPGPWQEDKDLAKLEKRQVSAYSEDGNRILQISIRSFYPDADANVIVAAPQLLEALKNIVAAVPMVLRDEGLLFYAEKVVEKAEGRS